MEIELDNAKQIIESQSLVLREMEADRNALRHELDAVKQRSAGMQIFLNIIERYSIIH